MIDHCLPSKSGALLQDLIDPNEYLKQFPAAFESQKHNFDTNAIARAYDAADFIGISNYASMRPDFQVKELESATFQFAREASYFGVDVKDLIFNKVFPWTHHLGLSVRLLFRDLHAHVPGW
jgi:hypothetical protein